MFELRRCERHWRKGVLDVRFKAPPLNLIGPELVRDLVDLVLVLPSKPDVLVSPARCSCAR